jgi:hypothetical protein
VKEDGFSMDDKLTNWARPHYREPGGRPFLFYIIYGSFRTDPSISAKQYRTVGVHAGLRLDSYVRNNQSDVFASFEEGYLWEMLLVEDPVLARSVSESDQCLILRGEIDDQSDLNYLRDSVGLLTYFLDHGGVCVYDPQMFRWWEPSVWRRRIFDAATAVPRHHVVILTSQEEGQNDKTERLTWFHTRGMRKFGRPDLSVHNVPARHYDAVIDLIGRFIELQALGDVISERQEIKMRSLPSGMTCRHQGHLDDPDFNNVHVEITMPRYP